MLATHRLQDAFGLANYQFDPKTGMVRHDPAAGSERPTNGNARPQSATAAPSSQTQNDQQVAPTNILVLKDGVAYFEGPAESLLKSNDPYLKQFLSFIEQDDRAHTY